MLNRREYLALNAFRQKETWNKYTASLPPFYEFMGLVTMFHTSPVAN